MTPFIPVFIFLLWLILFRRKIQNGISLNKEERILAYSLLFLTIIAVALQGFQFFGITPSFLIQYTSDIKCAILVVLPILTISIVVTMIIHHREHTRQSLAKRYQEKLERKTKRNLESEATTKNLAFPYESRDKVLSKLAKRLSSDIVTKESPIVYHVRPMDDRRDGTDVSIEGDVLRVPMDSALVLAGKMTELSRDQRYRKKYRFLLLP